MVQQKTSADTMTGSQFPSKFQQLKDIITKYPNATAYYAYIITKNGRSEDTIWNYRGNINPKFHKLTGKKVYELITGDPQALDLLWAALPVVISDLQRVKLPFEPSKDELMSKFFQDAF